MQPCTYELVHNGNCHVTVELQMLLQGGTLQEVLSMYDRDGCPYNHLPPLRMYMCTQGYHTSSMLKHSKKKMMQQLHCSYSVYMTQTH